MTESTKKAGGLNERRRRAYQWQCPQRGRTKKKKVEVVIAVDKEGEARGFVRVADKGKILDWSFSLRRELDGDGGKPHCDSCIWLILVP